MTQPQQQPPTPTILLTALINALSAELSPRTSASLSAEPRSAAPTILPNETKRVLQTLHTLLPHVTLDALDLLDRGCVTRLSVTHPEPFDAPRDSSPGPESRGGGGDAMQETRDEEKGKRERRHEYFVSGASSTKRYHVHTKAWNCECPVFVLACYSSFTSSATNGRKGVRYTDSLESHTSAEAGISPDDDERFRFGGLSRRRVKCLEGEDGKEVELAPPVCKHLLAAVLAEECGWLFGPRNEGLEGDGDEEGMGMGMEERRDVGRKGFREVNVSVREMAGFLATGGSGFVDVG